MTERSIRDEIARELYRRIYPGSVNTPDGKRTPESDAAELDRAYETWDEGGEGWAPGIRCHKFAAALMPLVKRAQAEALRDYRARLMDQNIDRFGVVLPDLHEVLDDLDEEADRIEKGEQS